VVVTDALSELCKAWRIDGGVHFRCELGQPWGLRIERQCEGMFHWIECGDCWLETGGDTAPIALHAGDLVLLPHGHAHVLVDRPGRVPLPARCVVGERSAADRGPVVHGGAGARTDILCGWLRFDRDLAHPLLGALPTCVLMRAADIAGAPALAATLALMRRETGDPVPGGAAVLARLVEVMVIQVLRWQMQSSRLPEGVLAALADRRLSTALQRLHREPERAWTIDLLARCAGCSRAVFALRFREHLGRTPLQYLTQWRMHRAEELLAHPALAVARVAASVGYASEASFGKAFKRHTGIAPGLYRRQQCHAVASAPAM
jgi:AraC family transcriptional regulator, alkane utilization regulator